MRHMSLLLQVLNFVKILYQTLSIKKRIKLENVSFIF